MSLNRHMRVHVGLPLLATHPVSPPPPPPQVLGIHSESARSLSDPSLASGSSPDFRLSSNKMADQEQPQSKSATEFGGSSASDRYCADCKIQFSSFKTFQVHKKHYCQSRKPAAGATLPASGIPDMEVEKPIQVRKKCIS